MAENEPAIADALEQDLGRKPFEAWLADIASTAGEAKDAAKNVGKWMQRKLPAAGDVAAARPRLGRVRAVRHRAGHRRVELPVRADARPRRRRDRRRQHRGAQTVRGGARLLGADGRAGAAYLDNDAIAVIEGDGAVSQELIAQGFDHLLFTGGTEIGRKVYEGAASHLTPVTLELGGKSPVIVAADADIDVAAKRIAWTKLINSGQICIAPDYVLADAHDPRRARRQDQRRRRRPSRPATPAASASSTSATSIG